MPAATSSVVTSRSVTRRSPAKLLFFVGFFALTILATYYKNARILDPASPIARHYAPATWFLPVHGIFGALALGLAAFQFSNRLRARYLRMHRILGYAYVTSVFISGPFAIAVAFKIPKAVSVIAANCVQALGWMVCTAIALYCIRRGNVTLHRRWMIRSYPFAMVFTVGRAVAMFVPSIALNPSAGEAVFWISIVLAAFVPSIVMDWPAMRSRAVARAASGAETPRILVP